MTCPIRSFSARVLRTTTWTTILVASAAYGQVASRYAGATPPVTSMSAQGAGSVEGFVYWDTRAVTHNPAGACNGFSVTVIAGGHALAGQFGAKYIGQVKSFLAGGRVIAYDVCTYAYDHVQENTPLSVQLAITQPSGFTGSVTPANPLSGPITIINGQCNMLPSATPTAGDLTARPGSCQNMAFDVSFQLIPASGSSRAVTLPRTGTVISAGAAGPGNSGPLLATGAQPTLLGNGGAASAATRPVAQPMITGGTTPAPGGLMPLGRSNTGAGSGTPSGGLQPLMPRNSLNGGTRIGLSGGSNTPLTNQDVLSLLSAGISEQNILTKIRNSVSSFDVSNQSRASFDAQCAAIKPPGVSSGAWSAEISDIWQTMNNVAICQQTNGRGGEGACDSTRPQAVLNNGSGPTPPVPSKPNGRNQYEAITMQRGVTQDPAFSKFASGGGTAATNAGVNNGTKNADDLNPQPYPPKGIASVGGGTAPAAMPMSSASPNGGAAAKLSLPPNLQVFTVGEAKNPAALNLVRTGPQLTANGGGMLGPERTMSATGGGTGIVAASAGPHTLAMTLAGGGPAAMQPGTNAGSRGVLSSALAKAACMSSGIAAVNGTRFTQFTPGTHYVITGCGFGSAPGKVYLTGPFAAHNGRIDLGPSWQYPATRTWTGHWSDQVIDAQLDQALSGELDQDNVVLVVETSTGQQIQMNNVSFKAQRAEFMLGSIPLSAIAPDPHNTFGLAVSPCTSSWVTGHCTVDVLRQIGAKVNSNPPDVYTIHLKPGFVLSRATLLVMDQSKVTSWTMPQINNGNQIVIDWQWSTYQSLSYSLYGLQIYVVGPLGVTNAVVRQ